MHDAFFTVSFFLLPVFCLGNCTLAVKSVVLRAPTCGLFVVKWIFNHSYSLQRSLCFVHILYPWPLLTMELSTSFLQFSSRHSSLRTHYITSHQENRDELCHAIFGNLVQYNYLSLSKEAEQSVSRNCCATPWCFIEPAQFLAARPHRHSGFSVASEKLSTVAAHKKWIVSKAVFVVGFFSFNT
jgi:hypothetical protein